MEHLFNTQPYLKTYKTTVIKAFEKDGHHYIQLAESIFYPQGGGQRGDRGQLLFEDCTFKVIKTIKDETNPLKTPLLEVEETINADLIGLEVLSVLDWDFRYAQMRLHTALHLFHCLLEENLQKPLANPKVSSIDDNGFAFNQYENEDINLELFEKAKAMFFEEIQTAKETTTYPDQEKEGYRWWTYDKYELACGGCHVKKVNEIGNVDIKYSEKKGKKTFKITLNQEKDINA